MSQNQFTRILFEAAIIFAIGLLGFMGLAVYNFHVIDRQSKLIDQMRQNPSCMVGK